MSKSYYQGKRYYTKNTVTDLVLLNHTMVISLFCLLTSSTVPTEVAPVLNYHPHDQQPARESAFPSLEPHGGCELCVTWTVMCHVESWTVNIVS